MLWSTKAKKFYLRVSNNNWPFRPLRKIPLSQRRILLVHLHGIFRHFSYHEKSFSGYCKKNLQFQEESDVRNLREQICNCREQVVRVVANCSEQTANQNTNIAAEVSKVARKRTSSLTVIVLVPSCVLIIWLVPGANWKTNQSKANQTFTATIPLMCTGPLQSIGSLRKYYGYGNEYTTKQ